MSLNRREFLKFSAGVSAAASSLSGGALQGAANGGEKHVHSFCEMCSSRCPIEAKVVDGKVRFLSGNPKAGGTATSLCARGGSGLSQLYDENRIKKPLIRAGERGENKWREVSWDEALDYVASKMLDIKQKYGPESFVFTCKSSQTHKLMVNFASAYGSPNCFALFMLSDHLPNGLRADVWHR